ncbi:MAG: M23 family metallopeptidase [Nocardioides sp.]|uniref:M23 family metallopeptidase n=1 Tax=Nocardioides sp. TaxID=35761 RepID=UPI003266FDC2
MTALRALLLATSLLLGLAASPAAATVAADTDPVGVWPLRPTPEVVHGFDPPDDPWGSGHRGVDLAGTVGQSVHSALAGTVAFVGKIAGKPVVTISHGDTRTTYEPVSSALEPGTTVAAGARIGTLELPFSHCFPTACLHWGWLLGDSYLDPLSLVGSGRVRLLPLWRDQPVDHSTSWQPAISPYAAWSPPLLDFLP